MKFYGGWKMFYSPSTVPDYSDFQQMREAIQHPRWTRIL